MSKLVTRLGIIVLLLVSLGGLVEVAKAAESGNDIEQLLAKAEASRVKDPANTQALLEKLANEISHGTDDELIRYQLLTAHQLLLRGQYTDAITSLKQVLASTDNPNRKMRALYLLAQAEGILSHFDASFEYIMQASELYSKLTEKQAKVDYFFIMTYMYSRVDDFDTALSNAEHLVKLAADGDPYQKCIAQQSLTTVYSMEHSMAKGLDAAKKQIALCQTSGGALYVADANLFIGRYYFSKNQPTEALTSFLKAKNGFDDVGYKTGQISTSVGIAKSFFAVGNKALAYSWANKALEMIDSQNQWKEQAELYQLLAKITAEKSDNTLVMYTEKYAHAVEVLANESKNTRLSYLQAKLRFDTQRQRISLLEQQNLLLKLQDANAKQHIWLMVLGLIAIAAVCASLGLLLMRNHRQQKRLRNLTEHDSLTELLNRQTLLKRAELLSSTGKPVAVVVASVDDFSRFNLQYGMQTSDRVVRRVAERFEKAFGSLGIVGRLGAAELAVVALDVEPEQVHDAVRLCQRPGMKGADANLDLLYSISFGLALGHGDESFDFLLQQAQKALKEAREKGQSCLDMTKEKETLS
ncbi:GGDEF domain-containing protein [Gallaecimonas mangrovi]|uniref:GGDEF domain-containing protein n=1 Tax=Gallaecimonas mangrovi TaxID=2291597 RepID=UPI000E206E89|nr:GGDEF domain-containing protein [Gallaecimonas mangrovi]